MIRILIIKICLLSLYSSHSGFYPIVREFNKMIENKGYNEKYMIIE